MIRDSTGSGAPWKILTISSWIFHLKQRKVTQIRLNDFIRIKSIGLSHCFDYKLGFFRVDDVQSTEGSKFIWAIGDHHARQEECLPLDQSLVIPLRDNIPSRTTPLINCMVIGACTLVFIMQLSEPRGRAILSCTVA